MFCITHSKGKESHGNDFYTITDNASHHNKINGNDVNVTVTTKDGVGSPTITGTGSGVLELTTDDKLDAS